MYKRQEETWYENGKWHREGGLPAIIRRDPQTGVITTEMWYENGKPHRENGLPTGIERDPQTGYIKRREFYQNGKQIRPSIVGINANLEFPDTGPSIP